MYLRTTALTLACTILLASACDKDEADAVSVRPGFEAEITGAAEDSWTGTATFQAPDNFVNNSARYTIRLETGTGVNDPGIIVNVLIPNEGRPDTPPIGEYSTGQFGPGTTLSNGGFAEFYTVNYRDFSYVDNPGTVTITRSDPEVVAGEFDVFIYGTNGTGNPGIFRGSFRAEPRR